MLASMAGASFMLLLAVFSTVLIDTDGFLFSGSAVPRHQHGKRFVCPTSQSGNNVRSHVSSLGLRASASSDERRIAEHQKILAGKRPDISVLDARSAWALLPDEMLERYDVVDELGRGSFGCVLLAKEKVSGDRVAIKICRPVAGEMAIVMREGFAMMKIKSDHVAALLEMGCSARDSDVVWFVMELLEGSNLNDILVQGGPLPVKEACRVGLDVLQGLCDVHEAGLIHRDIKPQNIVRVKSKDGGWKYKMIDLGSATAHATPLFQLPVDVFASIDKTGEGLLSQDEVQACLASYNMEVPDELVASLMGRHDSDGDGMISREEFGGMFAELSALPYSAFTVDQEQWAQLEQVFLSLDKNRNGQLTMQELQLAFEQLFRQPSREQLTWLMSKYDSNGDGKIDRDEFRLMYGELVALQDSMNLQGTHGYMPPELYNKTPLSPASDVWSLGATLFRLVSGQLPFTVSGSTWGQAMIGDLNVQAPKLKHLVFNVNSAFDEIIDRALRKRDTERFTSAAEMRQQLELVYQQLP